jgi:hypothetical protein
MDKMEMANDRCKNKILLREKSVRGNWRQMHFSPAIHYLFVTSRYFTLIQSNTAFDAVFFEAALCGPARGAGVFSRARHKS